MDGSYSCGSDKVGIGGIFRDFMRSILLQFAKEVDIDSVAHVELLTLREGLLVVVASR